MKYEILFKKFDISNFENKIFFIENRKQNRIFEITITFVVDYILLLEFSRFSNDDFFHSKIIETKNQILSSENSDFKFLIINNKNIMTILHDFADVTKNFESKYET